MRDFDIKVYMVDGEVISTFADSWSISDPGRLRLECDYSGKTVITHLFEKGYWKYIQVKKVSND